MNITLTLDLEQLDAILGLVEGLYSHMENKDRGRKSLAAEIEAAARRWTPDDDRCFDFHLVRLAPVYCQLLKYWEKCGAPPEYRGYNIETDSIVVFVEGLRAARLAVAKMGGCHA